LTGLARHLVQLGMLTDTVAFQAMDEASDQQIPFVTHLVQKGILKAAEIAVAGAREFGLPLLDIRALDLSFAPVKEVKPDLIFNHVALPVFKRGNRLFVAISDPTNLQALDEIKFHTGLTTEPVVVEDDKLRRAIDMALEEHGVSISQLLGKDTDDDMTAGPTAQGGDSGKEVESGDDAPVVKFVNKVLLDAINKGASDIHFEPYEHKYRVRFRMDGVLHEVASPPVSLADRLTARIKVMSSMDIAERRVPQDGRIKLKLSKKRAIDFRVSTCPTLFGEKIVLRILDPSSAKMGIDALGYEEDQKQLYLDALSRPYGMILVTGPTGSGKTVSLYTGLNILNTPDRNISTCEDPVEINMPGINQVHVNPKTGMTFAAALRSFLRQDPDVVMVGEIRDLETAEIAIKAAQTGHLVLSTLHTNDAPQTLSRLVNMGVPPYNIASAVSLIIAQRLARRLCNNCKKPVEIPREALLEEGFTQQDLDEGLTLYQAVGCEQCNGGYKGRVGIYQVMPVSEEIGRIIMAGGNAIQVADQARLEGIADLRTSGLRKVKEGITTLEEVNRVTVD
jgi:type IV pilus assembly protein PilB